MHFDSVAFVRCKGGIDCNNKFQYVGDNTCSSMNLLHSGNKHCPFACLGCGDCVKSCIYGAISISEKGCAVVDKEKCVGCAECVAACPNHLIELIPSKNLSKLFVAILLMIQSLYVIAMLLAHTVKLVLLLVQLVQ